MRIHLIKNLYRLIRININNHGTVWHGELNLQKIL